MFRLAHTYTALKASGIEDPLVVFGATCPDYAFFAETQEEKDLALIQPWNGGPALMVSDGLFSFGADLIDAP